MQSARIWFRQSCPPITLATVETFLEELGAKVAKTEWTLGTFVIPQLHVMQPVPFLIQLNDDEYVVEEAEEFVELAGLPSEIRTKLSTLDARLEVGDVSENAFVLGEAINVFEGWTNFDPSHPKVLELLRKLAIEFDGIFEDNVNGIWWPS
ncbi:hypothetical protein [Algihabitans sp.]|uniref:hypothetical protein n=1 Tax=Algihabitans sp. TaxID=2821514 RepID=UPI003BAB444B